MILRKIYNNKALLFCLTLLMSGACSHNKVAYHEAPQYGKVRFSQQQNSQDFSFIVYENFKKEDKSRKHEFYNSLSEKQVNLLTQLLKHQNYCIEKDKKTGEVINEKPTFLIKRKQPAAYQMLPEVNYNENNSGELGGNKIMVVPTTYYGRCVSEQALEKLKVYKEKIEELKQLQAEQNKKSNKTQEPKETTANVIDAYGKSQNIVADPKDLEKLQKKAFKKRNKESKNKEKMMRKKFKNQMKVYEKMIEKSSKVNESDKKIKFLF